MNANLPEAVEKSLTMTRIVGTCAKVQLEFQSPVVATFARRGALYALSKIHQVHTIATYFSNVGGAVYLDKCNDALVLLRKELHDHGARLQEPRDLSLPVASGQTSTQEFLVSVPTQMEFVRCYELLDNLGSKAIRLKVAGVLPEKTLNAIVCEAKQPFKRALGLFNESIEEARERYGDKRVGAANFRVTQMVQPNY